MFTCHPFLLIITLCVVLHTGPAFWWQPGLSLREGKKRGSWGVEWSGRRWSRVEWSGVKGECKMGSVSCIFWLKAQDAAPEQQIQVSKPTFNIDDGWLEVQLKKNICAKDGERWKMVYCSVAWFNAAECWWLWSDRWGNSHAEEGLLELFSPLLS